VLLRSRGEEEEWRERRRHRRRADRPYRQPLRVKVIIKPPFA
jgi:hypothetical protein